MCLLLFCSSGCPVVRKSSGPWVSLGSWPCAAAHWSQQGCSDASREAPCSLTGWVLWMSKSFLRSFYFKIIPWVWNKEKQQIKARSLWALTKVHWCLTRGRWAQPSRHCCSLWGGWCVLKHCPGPSNLQFFGNCCCLWRWIEAGCKCKAVYSSCDLQPDRRVCEAALWKEVVKNTLKMIDLKLF